MGKFSPPKMKLCNNLSQEELNSKIFISITNILIYKVIEIVLTIIRGGEGIKKLNTQVPLFSMIIERNRKLEKK